MNTTEKPKLYSLKEFAEQIQVSRQTLYTWNRKGVLKPAIVTPGGRKLYTEDQVKAYYDNQYAKQ